MAVRRSNRLPESDALLAALLFAVDPHGLGGVCLRGLPGPVRDRWLDGTRHLLPNSPPWLKVPINVTDDRLLGGLDFAATVGSGKPVFATGLLEAAADGVLLLSMAERVRPATAATIGAALDHAEVRVERDGIRRHVDSRFGVIALDEGIEDDEGISSGLADRLAFTLCLKDVPIHELDFAAWTADDTATARRRYAETTSGEESITMLCETALAFGVDSARAPLLALKAARAIAALRGDTGVSLDDAARAARLVLPQRAQRIPEPPQSEQEQPDETPDSDDAGQTTSSQIPDDVVVEAVRAAIPKGLLEQLARGPAGRSRRKAGGRGGPKTRARRRGRPVGVKPDAATHGQRLNVLATLKAAAPWQGIRQRPDEPDRLRLRPEDLHVTRFQDRTETTTLFVVDASGSQAAQRLAEVKGAIELLLNECYVRRDQVALIAFRGTEAETLLPPTRALARVKRSLAALPGGGGTPLANGIDAARELADSIARDGRKANIVLMTDGRANISRTGEQGAEQAEHDAMASGRLLQSLGLTSLLVDTSRRPRPRAQKLARAMGARYVPLPYADAARISETVLQNVS